MWPFPARHGAAGRRSPLILEALFVATFLAPMALLLGANLIDLRQEPVPLGLLDATGFAAARRVTALTAAPFAPQSCENRRFAAPNPRFVAPRWSPFCAAPRVGPSTTAHPASPAIRQEPAMNAIAILVSLAFFVPIALDCAMSISGLRAAA